MRKGQSVNLCTICVHPCVEKYFLQYDGFALGHDQHLFLDAVSAGGYKQSLRRFVERFEAERKSPVVHRD